MKKYTVIANEVKQSSTGFQRSIDLDCFASARKDELFSVLS
ncbi:hypothetical protein [Legionella impletisoli]|nr:hypothetical protein [Legionella impletisoli]